MRTEALLREAMDDLAATARTPDAALPRVLAHLPGTKQPSRNRRLVLVAALAVVLVTAAVVAPSVLRQQMAAPAGRVPGNWNLIHRVPELPPGWEQGITSVTATSETASYGMSGYGWACSVEVLAAGRALPRAIYGGGPNEADVNGRPANYGVLPDGGGVRLDWFYAADSRASVSCDRQSGGASLPGGPYADPRPVELDFARRVVFEPTPVRLPFELEEVPAGYQVHQVVTGQGATTGPVAGVQLSGLEPDEKPLLNISVNPGTTEVKPGLPGQETTTVDGRPAVLSATDGSLCLNDRGYTACIVAGGDATNSTASLWAPGQRELLLEVASHLTVVRHLDDPRRWPDANEALPR